MGSGNLLKESSIEIAEETEEQQDIDDKIQQSCSKELGSECPDLWMANIESIFACARIKFVDNRPRHDG